jgi:hypothetical protein
MAINTAHCGQVMLVPTFLRGTLNSVVHCGHQIEIGIGVPG